MATHIYLYPQSDQLLEALRIIYPDVTLNHQDCCVPLLFDASSIQLVDNLMLDFKLSIKSLILPDHLPSSHLDAFFRTMRLGHYDLSDYLMFLLVYHPSHDAISAMQSVLLALPHHILNTLNVYVQCNGNISASAKRLYLHRNTLIYRLDKLSSSLGLCLSSSNTLHILAFLLFKLNTSVSK